MKQRVLITGGNKGIGLELTKMFLASDHEVIVIARDFDGFVYADRVRCIVHDLTDVDAIAEKLDAIKNVDVLINNAGVMYSLPYDRYPNEKIEHIFALNLKAPVKLMELCAQKGVRRIVNNASIAGQIGHPDIWYGMTKAGLINVTKSFAKIFVGKIVVNAVAPSPVETEMLETIPLERREAFLNTVITRRFATAEEVAKTIFWLATESPEYINGTTVDINNGSFSR